MEPRERISESVIYEAYFDLWGLTPGWIKTIHDKVSSVYQRDDECELYENPACMAIRFRSCDKRRIEKAKRVFSSVMNLTKRSTCNPKECLYM